MRCQVSVLPFLFYLTFLGWFLLLWNIQFFLLKLTLLIFAPLIGFLTMEPLIIWSIHFIFFTSITSIVHFSIKLPNGNMAKVTHIGTVKLTSTLTLENVLCIPSFSFILVSISKVTQSSSCCCIFLINKLTQSPSSCCIFLSHYYFIQDF